MSIQIDKKTPSCVSCNSELSGKFCSNCGEKVIDEHNYSILNFINSIQNAFTDIDNNFFRSFYLLIKKPGFLSREYVIGKRVNYLKPIQIFLIANVIYFIIQPFTMINGYNTPLSTQINLMPYSSISKEMTDKRIVDLELSFESFEQQYNKKSENYAKSLVILMIPILAFFLKLLYFRSTRYFVEHLVFSVHFFSFYLFYVYSIAFLMFRLIVEVFPQIGKEIYLTIMSVSILFVYFYFSLHYFYKQKKSLTMVKSLILSMGVFFLIFIYRFILFFITLYSV